MMLESCSITESDAAAATERMADFFGPFQVDQFIRQALQTCWMALPKDRRNAEELERQLRRILERALKDFREDSEAFGQSPIPGGSANVQK